MRLTSDEEIRDAMKSVIKNVRVVAIRDKASYIVVKADTKRFGNDAVMFEGNTFEQCFDYIRRTFRTDYFKLSSYAVVPNYTDREGNTLPWILNVEI